jgi:proteasome accessory factor B
VRTATRIPLLRIAAIDRAIRAGEYPNAKTIASELEVCPRTIHRDIEFIRDHLQAPLAFDPVRNGYFYEDPSFELPLWKLTEGELLAIFVAERVLQQYRGTPWAAQLARAFDKITACLGDRVTINLAHLGRAHSFRVTAPGTLDPLHLAELERAIQHHQSVRLVYWSASSDEETNRLVDPYHLASIDGQWYLIAHCHLRDEVRMFVPGRIRDLTATDATFREPADFQIDAFLAHSFGVIRGSGDESHHVRLRFTGDAVRYVRERTWHASQALELQDDGALVLTMTLSHLREIERWAMSWGADCEVLGPIELREQVRQSLARSLGSYQDLPPRHERNEPQSPPRPKNPAPRRSRRGPACP